MVSGVDGRPVPWPQVYAEAFFQDDPLKIVEAGLAACHPLPYSGLSVTMSSATSSCSQDLR